MYRYTQYIVSVKLKGSLYGFGSCQKILANTEYLDWFKMHFPA